MSIWLREAEVEADKAELYWNEYFSAKESIESGNVDPQNVIETLSDEDAEIIAKALMSGELLDMSQFKYWRQRSIEEEIKQRGF